jgi:type IV secretory pathway VirB2 component (pilin)
MTAAAASLFEKPVRPVLGAASNWTQDALGGDFATTLCVIAIAILGLLLLAGRFRVKRGVRVVLGCFLLLGAELLAAQLQQLAGSVAGNDNAAGEQIILPQFPPIPVPPPADYDPYAGASLRRDR